MGFVTRDTGLGLVVSEHRGDEAQLSRALKRIDDQLVLQRHPANVEGGWVYKVFKVVSEDQPAQAVCTWCDEQGKPLPLSSGLVSLVESLRMGARNQALDAEAHNARLKAENDKAQTEAAQAVADEHRAKVERGQLTVSLAANTSKREWQRNHRPPSSGAAA